MIRSRSSLRLPPLVLLVASFFACTEPEPSSTYTMRDSAGIQIVESSGPAWGPGEAWRLSQEPVLTIGVGEGEEEYELYRVASALRLNTGEIAVACAGTFEVRFFDSAGSYLRSVGRQGAGPDEFNLIRGMWLLGPDSLAVFDYRNTRITLLGLRGEVGRSFIPTHPPGRGVTIPLGPFSDGSFLGRSHLSTPGDPGEGIQRGMVELVRWSPDGDLLGDPVTRLGWEQFYRPLQGEPMTAQPPFGRRFGVAASGDGWYYGSMDRFEIEEYSRAGELRRIIRLDQENRPVTDEIREEWLRQARERFADPYPAPAREWRLSMPFPETLPACGSGWIVDDEGNLWVPEYALPGEQLSWAVFNSQGRFLGTVDAPAGGRVTQIGTDFVLGIWTDDMDVEQVRMYRIIK